MEETPQARGHQRSSSDTQAFRERTKRDARDELQRELEKLEATARENKKAIISRQFAGFQHLFERFLQEEGPSLEWDHIQKLPEDAVSETQLYRNENCRKEISLSSSPLSFLRININTISCNNIVLVYFNQFCIDSVLIVS